MRIGIMQPYIFPYIGYYQLINAVDKFVLLDDVHFINRGWINRNRIVVNNQEYLFSIPLANVSQNRLIKDVELSNAFNWRDKFLKTISFSYKRAPFYSSAFPLIEEIVLNDETRVSKFIYYSLKRVLDYLGVKTSIVSSSSIYNNTHLKGQERIIDICQKENACIYINAIGGIDLYEKNDFADKRIKLCFIKAKFSKNGSGSTSALSMVDILMNYPKEKIQLMLQDYDLE